MNRAYCLTRADYHKRMRDEYRDDAETALVHSVGTLKDEHYDHFMKSAEMHEEQIELWKKLADGEMK